MVRSAVPGSNADVVAHACVALACLMALLYPVVTRGGHDRVGRRRNPRRTRVGGADARQPGHRRGARPRPARRHARSHADVARARRRRGRRVDPGRRAASTICAASGRGTGSRCASTARRARSRRSATRSTTARCWSLERTAAGITAERAGLPYFIEVKGVAGTHRRAASSEDAARGRAAGPAWCPSSPTSSAGSSTSRAASAPETSSASSTRTSGRPAPSAPSRGRCWPPSIVVARTRHHRRPLRGRGRSRRLLPSERRAAVAGVPALPGRVHGDHVGVLAPPPPSHPAAASGRTSASTSRRRRARRCAPSRAARSSPRGGYGQLGTRRARRACGRAHVHVRPPLAHRPASRRGRRHRRARAGDRLRRRERARDRAAPALRASIAGGDVRRPASRSRAAREQPAFRRARARASRACEARSCASSRALPGRRRPAHRVDALHAPFGSSPRATSTARARVSSRIGRVGARAGEHARGVRRGPRGRRRSARARRARAPRTASSSVLHDDTLDRTTDGTGPVRARTLAEVERLDAGHHFPADGPSVRGRGIRVPTLARAPRDAFPTCRSTSR